MKLKKSILIITCLLAVFLFACGDKSSITFKDTTLSVDAGYEFELAPIVEGKNKEVVYSYDTTAFELIAENKFKALVAGEYEIVASLKKNESIKATITIIVAHTHTFDQKVASDAYLASKATCEEKAKYYYSCTCGEKGTETFEDGELSEHVFDQKVASDAYLASKATCEEKAKYYYSCTCGEKGTETFEDGELEKHVFDQKVASDAYLASKATCEEKAKYYYSCTCGEKGTETFEDGELGKHVFDQKVASDAYLASKATCEEKAKYYYSCTCGEKGTETFEDGELEKHVFDQKVMDDKYAVDDSGSGYYYSCICGEKGTEIFYNIVPVEVATTVADDNIANLETGSTYKYNNVEYIVGLTAFATIAEAMQYATETVYVADGTYNEEIIISKSNLKLLGNNVNINPNLQMRNAESVLTKKVNLAQDVKNIVISGFCFTLDAQFLCAPNGGNEDIVFEYNIFDSEITTVTGYPTGGEIVFNPTVDNFNKNLTVRYNRFLSTGGKTYHLIIQNLENFTAIGNYFEGTYAQVYADSIMFDDVANYGGTGEIVIENNEFVNISQYAIVFWDYYQVNLKIVGNKFTNCGVDGAGDGYVRAAVALISALSSAEKSTVLIEKNIMENVDTCVRVQYSTPEKIEVTVKHNKFISWVENEVITNNGNGTGNAINAEYNYFGQNVSDANFKGVTSWANKYDNVDDVPEYGREEQIYINKIEITNKVDKLPAYSEYKLEYSYEPDNVTTNKIIFKSSDESIATISDRGVITILGSGKVTIYAYSAYDETIVDSFEFEVKSRSMIDASYEGNGVLRPNETLTIEAVVKGEEIPAKIEYVSNDPTIAEVDENGVVTAINEGSVNIIIKSGELETIVALTVLAEDKELSELMQLLIESNNGTVFYDVVDYIGYEAGFEKVPHKVYGSVNAYWADELPNVIKNMVPTTNPNYTGQYMTKVEYVVIHDTGAANPGATAQANSGWCTNPTNDGTSWHYTIGNDGIYQQLEDNMIAWHAGDWSQRDPAKFAWYDTGIKYEYDRPTVTIGDDGYFYVNGTKSLVQSPRKEDGSIEKNINKIGLVCVKGENGNYMIPTTWISDESGYPVCVYGGNSNGIGIETCVNSASDLWLTWQYSAKFAAQLLIKYNLHSDRLVFHNNFTNKTCPNTMITNGLVEDFLRLFEVEYRIAKEFSDYQITFTSHNPEILDNTGRIVNAPDYTTSVSYTITVSKDGVTEEVTLNSLVPGRYGLEG